MTPPPSVGPQTAPQAWRGSVACSLALLVAVLRGTWCSALCHAQVAPTRKPTDACVGVSPAMSSPRLGACVACHRPSRHAQRGDRCRTRLSRTELRATLAASQHSTPIQPRPHAHPQGERFPEGHTHTDRGSYFADMQSTGRPGCRNVENVEPSCAAAGRAQCSDAARMSRHVVRQLTICYSSLRQFVTAPLCLSSFAEEVVPVAVWVLLWGATRRRFHVDDNAVSAGVHLFGATQHAEGATVHAVFQLQACARVEVHQLQRNVQQTTTACGPAHRPRCPHGRVGTRGQVEHARVFGKRRVAGALSRAQVRGQHTCHTAGQGGPPALRRC